MDRKTQLRDFITSSFLFGKSRAFADTASLQEEGIVDSTGLMAMVLFIEQTYNFKVSDEDLVPANFDSIDGIDSYIGSRLRI